MKHTALFLALASLASSAFAVDTDNKQLLQEIKRLQNQSQSLQNQINHLQKRVAQSSSKPTTHAVRKVKLIKKAKVIKAPAGTFHSNWLSVHTPDTHPESIGFYPTALIAGDHIVTYIAGTPVVTSPYLGDRPAFDGSDYIVNISSINRDIRLMQQRRRLYRAYQSIGYPVPYMPIVAISGKSEPIATIGRPYFGKTTGDLNLGSSELDVAAALNDMVEAFMGIAYDETPPAIGGQRLANSAFDLNLGFVNIGNLDKSPFYFTAGQLYAPFGKYASAMVSSPLTLILARTKTRPFIVGYKSQVGTGPYAAVYGFKSDTTLGHSGVGGVNVGYTFEGGDVTGELGAGYIGSMADSGGMQSTGSAPFTTFGGFSSVTNGSEAVSKRSGVDVHGNVSFDRYTLAAEWVGAGKAFRAQDLSFNGRGAKPQAAQFEAGVTFQVCSKPASLAAGYQWSQDTLALNLPHHRVTGVFNISLWKDTIESLEYRHDIDFKSNQFANGISSPAFTNQNTIGSGKASDTVTAQIGVYF